MNPTTHLLDTNKAKRIAQSPYFFAANYLKIQDKDDNIIPFILNPLQIDYLKNRSPRDLILKPRQIGFSTAIQGEIARYSWTRPTRSLTLTDETANTTKMRLMQQKFYDYLPAHFRPKRSVSNATLTIYPEYNSEMLSGTAGNVKVGRAGSYRVQHYSEVGFYKDAAQIMKAALQGGRPFWVIAESTPNGASGWFYERCMEALANPELSVWKLHFYAWFQHPEYQMPLLDGETLDYSSTELGLIEKYNLTPEQVKWRRYKVSESDEETFIQEYPSDPIECFLSSGGGVFTIRPDSIQQGIEQIEPQDDKIYVAGLDWGQDNDYTALSIIEVSTDGTNNREVYISRWRKQSWSSIRAEIVEVLGRYHVEKIVPEKNSMGSSQIEQLGYTLEDAGLDIGIRSFTTTSRSKDNIVKLMKRALDEEGFQLLDVDYANHEMRIFETSQTPLGTWTYGAPKTNSAHDDCVMARMLANFAASQLWI